VTGNLDASIKLLYIVDKNTFFASDSVEKGTAFDVVANVEIGKELMENIRFEDLFVSIINVTQATATSLPLVHNEYQPVENPDPFQHEMRVEVAGGWTANEGDILEAVAAYKVTAGVHTDYSVTRSGPVVVSTP
jgi:hypothetical protein